MGTERFVLKRKIKRITIQIALYRILYLRSIYTLTTYENNSILY